MSRVLVLDDEPLIAMMLEDWLAELGHETVGPARSISAAMSLIEANAPDAAILDVSLNGEVSYPVADALAQRGVPFAFATGHSGGTIEAPHQDAPLLSKPFDFEAVKKTLARLLP